MGLLDDAIREHLELKRLHGADAGEVARQEHEALGPVRREDIAIPDPADSVSVDHGALQDEPDPFAVSPDPVVDPPHATEAVPVEPLERLDEPATTVDVAADPSAAAPPERIRAAPPVQDVEQATVAFSLDDLEAAESAAPAASADPLAVVDPEPVAAVAPPPVESPAAEPPAAAEPPPEPAEPPSTQELAWTAEEPVRPPAPTPAEPVAPDVVPADDEPGEHDELEETPDFLQETPEHDRLWFEQKPPRDFDF